MPFRLDTIDVAVLQSLLADGRKSFRQISRETKISTPTVKARYERLVRIGLIKAVVPLIDTGLLEKNTVKKLDYVRQKAIHNHSVKFDKDMLVKMACDYCEGPVHEKPHILKVGNFERFFCCPSCRTLYKEKYKYKIQSLSAASV
ncbi:MAG: winged helix-turn-helix transcriptional regulator [Candidatus Nitrosotenuis sp.]|uniref:Putative transcriptional regulator, AsnC family n=1 Tax=Candidatus Nitrosotenuis uzonensis TaxID=1407055 RepID=A0A812ETH7_9ARCH|nr:winged helix-turn-helix transcriptional regulator [Candidatus Nitrosotenuis uzonensis]MCA2003614.1 winged helix-turn-helix transcriptional regulator [Candidatus Nitrosotenuis sp.]CAE6486375.1 putative transcriptional regulator, AsnC family [Candidatus Nitrosotenuis uzonensis]